LDDVTLGPTRLSDGYDEARPGLAMRNSKNAIVYYLFLASPKAVAEKIISDIFRKYA
jgi:hypothetical protein